MIPLSNEASTAASKAPTKRSMAASLFGPGVRFVSIASSRASTNLRTAIRCDIPYPTFFAFPAAAADPRVIMRSSCFSVCASSVLPASTWSSMS